MDKTEKGECGLDERHIPRHPLTLMYAMYRHVLPAVNRELGVWIKQAERIPDAELRTQANASIGSKKFHCQGGAVYALLQPRHAAWLTEWIVAFQTISDYLDNLCDRSTSLDGNDFRQLHQAMLDAVDPDAQPVNYYALRTNQEDGGYLAKLVETCRNSLHRFPSFAAVRAEVRYLVQLYCDLQVHKHIRRDLREQALLAWWQEHEQAYPQLRWNEFAAATGSTLGVFYLMACALTPNLSSEQAQSLRNRYFPAICGLHILLDYVIDQEEDRLGGDLNFCFYYTSEQEMYERLQWFVQTANEAAQQLNAAPFHRMIVEGLLALYLSDQKVTESTSLRRLSRQLLQDSPPARKFFYWNSRWIRKIF
jgi:tetraprenyl-beta-curcumene synthase